MFVASTAIAGEDFFTLLGAPAGTAPASDTRLAQWTDSADAATPSEPLPVDLAPVGLAAEPIATPEPSREREQAGPTPAVGGTLIRSIRDVTLAGDPDPELADRTARLPDRFAIRDESRERFGELSAPVRSAIHEPPRFAPNVVTWAAPAFYSRPLYFEQPNVERYGHHVAICERDTLTQSALSAVHFFASVPALPYALAATPPDACGYVLGSYRPGSCNPHQLVKPPLSLRGVTLEGVAAVGLVLLVP